jgi:hypothetical protein
MKAVRTLIIAIVLISILASAVAVASMPSVKGVSYPSTVWSDRGIKGTVSGKVVTSLDQSTGVQGAYVAVVNALDNRKEYANTTTDKDGNFALSGLSATYSSVRQKGPDGTSASYNPNAGVYMIYVNKSDTGEGYSSAFSIDTNHSAYSTGPVVIYAGIPEVPDETPTPEPTAAPTAAPTDVAPTPAPATPTPEPPANFVGQYGWIIAIVLLIALAIVAVVAYFRFLRDGLMKKLRKK